MLVPAPANCRLAVIIAPPADQVDPLYASVQANVDRNAGDPPNPNAAFCVPVPANSYLAVDRAPPADHDDPLYVSVQAQFAAFRPPNAKAVF